MGKILKLLLLTVACVAAVLSCTPSTCDENSTAIPLACFYASESKRSISLDSLTVYGVGAPGDTVIMYNGTGTQVYLPLRMNANNCQFVFHHEAVAFSDTRYNDTLTINYNPIPYFSSMDCGAMYYYDVMDYEYSTNLVDSVRIITDRFTNADIETVQIYFRVDESAL